MAERTIDYKITAKDEASGVFSRFSRNLQKSMKEAEVASGKIIGPSTINRQMLSSTRTIEEQAIRDLMANRIKEMRRAAAEERIKAIAEEKLFGSQLSATMRQTNQRVAKELTGLDKIKSLLGARGSVKNVAELFVGGGAIAAVGFITNSIANAARNARELTDEFREGKIEAGELADRLAGTIPILGSIWRAGRDIREVITGEQYAIKEATKEAEFWETAMKVRIVLQKRSSDATKEHLSFMRELNQEMQVMFLGDRERDIARAGFSAQGEKESRGKVVDDLVAAEKKAYDDIAKDLKSRRDDLQGRLSHLTRMTVEDVDFSNPTVASGQMKIIESARVNREKWTGEIEKLDNELKTAREKHNAELTRLEKQRSDESTEIAKRGSAEVAKVRADAATEAVRTFLRSTNEMLRAADDYNRKAVDAEKQAQESIRRTRDETFRRYMSQHNAAMRMAEANLRDSAPGRGTASTQEVRFATRVGSPEDSIRRTGLDEQRKAARAAVDTQKIVTDILSHIQKMTGVGQPVIEIYGN